LLLVIPDTEVDEKLVTAETEALHIVSMMEMKLFVLSLVMIATAITLLPVTTVGAYTMLQAVPDIWCLKTIHWQSLMKLQIICLLTVSVQFA